MLVLGLILILVGLAVGGYTVAAGLPSQQGTDVSLSLLGLTVQTSAVVVFALGALTLLLLELGVLALRSGARKSARRRAELQRLRRVEAEVQARQSAESQRNASATTTAAAPAPFARREPAVEHDTTGPTRADVTRPDVTRPEDPPVRPTGSGDTLGDTRHDLSAVRPPETGGYRSGASADGESTDGSTRTV